MAAKPFTPDEWDRIRRRLADDPDRYGLPDRVYGSVVLASFNIRKLGSATGRNADTWQFLADVCRHFDLLAVQEIMDDLSGLRRLKGLIGPEFGMIVSDKTGVFPGEPGVGERLGFVYNRSRVHRTEIATDITYDRSKLINTLADHHDAIHEATAPYAALRASYRARLEEFEAGEREQKPKRPRFRAKLPTFLSFIRAPFCASFEITGHPGTTPYQFMAIAAHLHFGHFLLDRRQEFDALMSWIRARAVENDRAYYPDFVLLGDLNLDFDDPAKDREKIEAHLKTFNDAAGEEVSVNFPFLDPHPVRRRFLRTNARLNETFDQIGLFCRDPRFPTFKENEVMGREPTGPDYGVFDFVDLFSEALRGVPFNELGPGARKNLLARFEHKVSDHMPLWLRLPLPRQ
ncbi:MAG: exonuclease/endonuclease/phosphatase family protein [Planctomycetota bacterium]|jgi:endonuclease/exonuclease/phosphatase family metal-dependent hydrolase